jgi:hypothetical protein
LILLSTLSLFDIIASKWWRTTKTTRNNKVTGKNDEDLLAILLYIYICMYSDKWINLFSLKYLWQFPFVEMKLIYYVMDLFCGSIYHVSVVLYVLECLWEVLWKINVKNLIIYDHLLAEIIGNVCLEIEVHRETTIVLGLISMIM